MKQIPEHIDELLVRHLLGEAGPEEQADAERWLAEDEAHRRHYRQMEQIWEQSRQLAARSTPDTEAAWQRFRQKIGTEAATAPQVRTISLRPRRRLAMAAALLLLLLGLGWAIYYFAGTATVTLQAANAPLTDTLPDGSVIRLSSHSRFTYPRRFAASTRAVQLDGEAFFDISPDKSRPFVITANGISVKVVGTSFNVRSSAARTTVVVETGIVEVRKRQEAVLLHPHEQASVAREDARPVKRMTDDLLYRYYRTREIACNGIPLWRLAELLSSIYDREIILADDRLRNLQLTTTDTFRDEPLENILSVIGSTLDIAVEQEGRNFVLKPRS